MERRSFLKQAMAIAPAAIATPMALGELAEAQTAQSVGAVPTSQKRDVGHPAPRGPKVTLNVKDLGATGDGKTKDTLALQLAIERCANLGGGEVVVPAGDYLTGALTLKSGVTLRIDEGATLQSTTDLVADYALAQVRWE